ncbi:hypothetical protein P3T21_004507 [Paraburkholderia sp. GAS334]
MKFPYASRAPGTDVTSTHCRSRIDRTRALRRARYTLLNALLKIESCETLFALGYVDFPEGLRVWRDVEIGQPSLGTVPVIQTNAVSTGEW